MGSICSYSNRPGIPALSTDTVYNLHLRAAYFSEEKTRPLNHGSDFYFIHGSEITLGFVRAQEILGHILLSTCLKSQSPEARSMCVCARVHVCAN